MADTMRFELVSPEKLLLSGDAASATVPGSEGDFGVGLGHASFVSTLKPGVLSVTMSDGASHEVFVRGGFAEVGPDSLIVLAEQATPVAELKAEQLAEAIKNVEDDVADATDDEKRRIAQEQLDRLKEVTAALKAAGHA
jgi:F-type H+-transporting ATPase subunit epsilon